MSAAVQASGQESEDLEALFDSIVKDNNAREQASASPEAEAVAGDAAESDSHDVRVRIGKLTRTLHDALRELGYDRLLEQTASEIPDARDRLDYVVKMTEQAAVRALNAIEAAQPIQDKVGAQAEALSATWQKLYDRKLSLDEFTTLVAGTREFLADVPKQTRATNAQLLEIMMAQDFQDLTGQVIKRITTLAQNMEQQLIALLVDMAPADIRSEIDAGLLNGPVVNATGRTDVVTNQDQVDDLLESLGF